MLDRIDKALGTEELSAQDRAAVSVVVLLASAVAVCCVVILAGSLIV